MGKGKTPEGDVKDALKSMFNRVGAYYFMPVQTGYGKMGVDFFVCCKGWFLAVEAKALNGVLTTRQGLCLEKVRNAGGYTFVVYGLPDVARLEEFLLEGIGEHI
jgi:hypothetical protein